MCGIAGIVDFNGESVEENSVKTMTRCMRHRGPDDEGFFITPQVGIGICRLSIVDIREGGQPISNEDETIYLVLNGEIYNHRKLRHDLERRGHKFRTHSDAEVVIHAYEEKSFRCIEDLNGMFAFALYDKKRKGLWLARDRLGIKPLYYYVESGRYYFFSDLSVVRKINGNNNLSKDAFWRYLAHGYVPSPYTAYEGVYKFPPASHLWIEQGQRILSTYWESTSFFPQEMPVKEAEEGVSSLLRDAIVGQMSSDVPIGVMLSGGIDSSAIVAIASRYAQKPINTFTAIFSGEQRIDQDYSRRVAEQCGTAHHEVRLEQSEMLDALEELLPRLDEPISDSALISTYLISRSARSMGVKVLLSGAGGDELFGGYWRHLPPPVGSSRWMIESLPFPLRFFVAKAMAIIQPSVGRRLPDLGILFAAGISAIDLGLCKGLVRDRSNFYRIEQALREIAHDMNDYQRQFGYSFGRMHTDLKNYLCGNILALTDKATMAVAVEGRVPFLDHRLVEFAYSIEPRINLLNGQSKGLLKNILKKYLPEDLLERKKEGFNAPMQKWAKGLFLERITHELKSNLCPFLKDIIDTQDIDARVISNKKAALGIETLFSLYIWNRWFYSRNHPSE